ncbi:unnamed protein product, partial [Mesorhabditis belari]|uniref:Uncharacterized protein n=1 Tax=Mesorhabditis belari TaxID=2138241 RepID=A0AAF3J9T1_9BILA
MVEEVDCLIKGQKPFWGIVCSRAHSASTHFVRFLHGQLMLTHRSRNWEQDSNREVKVGDLLRFIWKPHYELDECVGVVDTYIIVPPEKQPYFLSASLQPSHSGQIVLVSCELRYEGNDGKVATFVNEHLGRVFDDHKKIHEKALTTQGVYQCLITRRYILILIVSNGSHHGFAVRVPHREEPLIWPTDSISKRPITIHKEVLSGFHEKNLGLFVDYWLIPGSRTIGRMQVATCQPPTKKVGDRFMIALDCSYTGHRTRVNDVDVLSSRMYRWIEDRQGFAKALNMKKGDSQYFWCYLDTSSTNAAYLDWVVIDIYDEKVEGSFVANSAQASCYPKDLKYVGSLNEYALKSAESETVELEEFGGNKWYARGIDKPQQSYSQDSIQAKNRVIEKWIDAKAATWETIHKEPGFGESSPRYENTRFEGKSNQAGHKYFNHENNAQHEIGVRGATADMELLENMKQLRAIVREIFQEDEVREAARRVNPNAYAELIEKLAFDN